MTSKFSIENRELLQRISSGEAVVGIDFGNLIVRELAAFRLAAMDSEPVEMPLDYLQGHKDGLEWAAKLAEANHPETGDWLYDDPIELAKAIRKGPDIPPSQPVLDTEPVAYTDERNLGYIDRGRETAYLWGNQNSEASDVALYRHAQPAPVVPEDFDFNRFNDVVWLECVASNPHMHSPTTSAIARVALELNKRSATMEAEPDRNPVLAYADSYRDMAKQGVDSVPIWNIITDLERNIAPLYRHAQPAQVVPDEKDKTVDADDHPLLWSFNEGWNACRAAMLQAGTLTNEGTKQAWTGIPDIDNAINMLDRIDTLESCDDDRIEAVKTVLRGLAGNSPVIPDGSADMLRRWLAFGRGMQNAGSQLPHNLIAETESMLAAAPQEDINALIPLVSRDEQEVK